MNLIVTSAQQNFNRFFIRFTDHTDYVTDIAWVNNSCDGQVTDKEIIRLYSVSTDKSMIENTVHLDNLFP